jgi:hypothetical protein
MSSAIPDFLFQGHRLMSIIRCKDLDYIKVFKNTLLSASKRSKFTYLGTAIALYVVAKMYRSFAYPRNLAHIKRVPLLSTVKALITNENPLESTSKFLLPNWKETNGVVAMYSPFGWSVVVTNPDAVKTVLYKTGSFRNFGIL